MAAWFKRFGLHLAAAVGATGIFVAAAAVGANQTRQQGESALGTLQATGAVPASTPLARPKPSVVRSPAPTHIPSPPTPAPTGAPLAQASPPPAQVSPPLAQTSPPDAQPDLDETPPAAVAPQPGPPAAAAPVAQAQPPDPPNTAAPKPSQPRRTPTPVPAPAPAPSPTPAPEKVAPERSLAGTIKDVQPDGLDVLGVGGREWHVVPAPGALIRLNGKAARLDGLHVGDTVVILGQAQAKQGAPYGFLAHAITAKRK